MNKKGMTLQELLITIAIIGVIAAVTIPQIVGQIPSKNKINFLKAYNTISNMIPALLDDPSIYINGELDKAQPLNNESINDNSIATKLASLIKARMNIREDSHCNASANGRGTYSCSFTTVDNMSWRITDSGNTNKDVNIIVDVNNEDNNKENSNKKYNDANLGNSIPDIFTFTVSKDGNLSLDNFAKELLKNPHNLKKEDVLKALKTVTTSTQTGS